jgi:chemotaxis protein histidine kinase CheA
LADRLVTLSGLWHDASIGGEHLNPTAALDTLRDGLSAIAFEAEATNQAALAQAVRRIALLSELWECLQCEPDRAEAAAEVAAFCLDAIECLVCDQETARENGDPRNCDEIVRQSDLRWSDYLSPVDSASASRAIADEPVGDDEACPSDDDAPPALDQETLLRLLNGPGHDEFEASHTVSLEFPPVPTDFDLDDEMREAFVADASDLFERIERTVVGLGSLDDHRDAIRELNRCLHTLKGAAGSVGLHELAALVHELEEQLGQSGSRLSHAMNDRLHEVVAYLDNVIGRLRRSPGPRHQAAALPTSGFDAFVPPDPLRPDSSSGGAPPVAEPVPVAPVALAEGPIRVPPARLDELTDLASELIVQGRFWLSQAGSMRTFAAAVQDCRNRLLGSLDRLHDARLSGNGRGPAGLFGPDADFPAQLRRLEEQADDLAILAASAHAAAEPMTDHGDSLIRLSRQFWESLQSLRIVPIRGLFQRLARVLHDAARIEGRQVEVVMKGEETGVDRAVQDRAFEPLLHVVRNAAGHGIESPADRVKAGKPAAGRVTLEARREENTLVIVVRDDGKGVDDAAVAAKARQLGWLGPDEQPSRERLHSFLFQTGFSTKSQADAISGRGVGMDVVAREVAQLRGTLELTSQPGCGTQLVLRLPARLALEPSVIVRVADQALAIPAAQVEYAQPFEPSVPGPDASPDGGSNGPVPIAAGSVSVTYRSRTIPAVFAHELLGIGGTTSVVWPKLVIVRSASQLIGLVVDTIEGAEDLVIKPLGALLAGHPLVSGTSLSIKGEVISVLNASGLLRWVSGRIASGASKLASGASGAPGSYRVGVAERMTVLVVDDSISVRRGMARQLRGLGLEVHEAPDGLAALGRLRSLRYGLVLTDLEMPKLDGFALLAEIKRSASLATIPVIVASTRCDPETRRRLMELGSFALLAKPVAPQELARIIEPFLAGPAA